MRRDGWSLVEMMVVIAIAVFALGLLIPALASVRASGQAAACTSNLRQMSVAAQAYLNLYDVYPPAIRYENREGQFTQIAWDWVTTLDGQLISPGPLWAFTDDPDHAQQCPAHHGPSTFSGDPFTGYNYNTTYIGGEAPFPSTGWANVRWGVRPGRHRRTETTALFGDGAWAGGANKFMRAPMGTAEFSLPEVYAGGQAFRHQKATNVAYLDGHVAAATRPHRGLLATESLLHEQMAYPLNGFLSDDDSAYDPR